MGKLKMAVVKGATFSGKPVKLADGDGLYLLVNKTGKYWRYDYRFRNKRKTLALGIYPETSLSDARERHYQARVKIAQGIDPCELRKMSKIDILESAENSFQTIAMEWFVKQNWTDGHRRTVKGAA